VSSGSTEQVGELVFNSQPPSPRLQRMRWRAPLSRKLLGPERPGRRARTLALAVTWTVSISVSVRADGLEEWFKPTRISVTTTTPPAKDYSHVDMSMTKSDDARIDVSGSGDGKNYSGSLILVAGNRLLTRGVEIEPGAEIDALDVPVLEVRLACELLARALPNGPRSVTSRMAVNLRDRQDPVKINTASATGEYQTPWSLNGTVRPDGTGRAFDLVFGCAGMDRNMHIVGRWTMAALALELPDSMSAAGWRVFALGPYSKQDGRGTILDYGAKEIHSKFTTLGDVRRDAVNRKQ
jgi:hypothetical protein